MLWGGVIVCVFLFILHIAPTATLSPQLYLSAKEVCRLDENQFLSCQPISEKTCHPNSNCTFSCDHCCDPFLATSAEICHNCISFSCDVMEKSLFSCNQDSTCWCPDCCSKYLSLHTEQCSQCYMSNGCNHLPQKLEYNCRPGDLNCRCPDCCSHYLSANPDDCQRCYEMNNCTTPNCTPNDPECWCSDCCSKFLSSHDQQCQDCYLENNCMANNTIQNPITHQEENENETYSCFLNERFFFFIF
jgi:hypothetical protein